MQELTERLGWILM